MTTTRQKYADYFALRYLLDEVSVAKERYMTNEQCDKLREILGLSPRKRLQPTIRRLLARQDKILAKAQIAEQTVELDCYMAFFIFSSTLRLGDSLNPYLRENDSWKCLKRLGLEREVLIGMVYNAVTKVDHCDLICDWFGLLGMPRVPMAELTKRYGLTRRECAITLHAEARQCHELMLPDPFALPIGEDILSEEGKQRWGLC